ncbi:MAG TPA: ATP-binding protein [Kofleriaceae bacterium]|nr:ATP-binding protein [Kofleriaceae bacterium]
MSAEGVGQLFHEALQHASPGFALGARLAALFPDRHLLEGEGQLSLTSFASAGHCRIEERPGMYQQFDHGWWPELGVRRSFANTWHEVTWRDETFDLISLEYPGGSCERQRFYVVGRDRATTESFFAEVSRWNHEVRGEILVFSNGCFHKDEKLYAAVQAASFDQLVLEGSFSRQIRDDFHQFLAARATYEDARVPWRRGALFIGPPGNGKTLCVKALVRELAIPCLYVRSFQAQYETPQALVESVFARARGQAPCIMVLEDIDALLVEGSRSFFLNELDGFAENTGILTIATTNHPERLDPSIVERPSRFDRKYHFELPSAATRAVYVAGWNERLAPALRLDHAGRVQLVELTDGFSFAYIQEVFVAASMHWAHARPGDGLLAIALEQVAQLRAQMRS